MNTQTAALTSEQLQKYNEDGFFVEENLLSTQEVEHFRTVLESPEIAGEVTKSEGHEMKTIHLLELAARHPDILNLALDPRIVNRIKPLLGDDIQLQHSKLGTKPPTKGTGEFKWHQDFPFYPHTNASLLTVAVWLDDCTLENGCLQMVRGSHRLGCLDHLEPDGTFQGSCQEARYWEDQSKIEDILPKAGGISVHHCLTLHGSPPNLSGKPRRGVIFSYRAGDAYQLADHVFRDTGILVCGERRGQVRLEAGTLTLPRRANMPWTGAPFGEAWNQIGEMAREHPEAYTNL